MVRHYCRPLTEDRHSETTEITTTGEGLRNTPCNDALTLPLPSTGLIPLPASCFRMCASFNSLLTHSWDRSKSLLAWQRSVWDLQFRYSMGLLCTSEHPSAV
ncbi:unnamed protein product [Pleuronectes platessa]|uniref:Uncharacterized protein n=1 Tax=Pleuronectes platessa TaxID=8262 RepID=A0A9N7YET2_PLEPL|nr:unnamed protein product [Pleuronectes platessa]